MCRGHDGRGQLWSERSWGRSPGVWGEQRAAGGWALCHWDFCRATPCPCHPINPARTSVYSCHGRIDSIVWRGSQNGLCCAWSFKIMVTRAVCWHLGKKKIRPEGVVFWVMNTLKQKKKKKNLSTVATVWEQPRSLVDE